MSIPEGPPLPLSATSSAPPILPEVSAVLRLCVDDSTGNIAQAFGLWNNAQAEAPNGDVAQRIQWMDKALARAGKKRGDIGVTDEQVQELLHRAALAGAERQRILTTIECDDFRKLSGD